VLPNYIQIVSEVPASRAGVMMFPGALVGALFAPLSGQMLDKLGFKKPIGIGILTAIVGWLGLIFVIQTSNMLLITTCHVIFMIGVGLQQLTRLYRTMVMQFLVHYNNLWGLYQLLL
jgi:MFS family permease